MVSRVRKKFALMKYSPDAAGVPLFAPANVLHWPDDRQSVGLFANVPRGSPVVDPVRHSPGAPLGNPFPAGASLDPPARVGSGTQNWPGMHSAFAFPVAASAFKALQNDRLPCFGASMAAIAIPDCVTESATSSMLE